MRFLSRYLDRFCYKHNNIGIPGLMRYIVIANVCVFFMDIFSGGVLSSMLSFIPAAIFSGQIWRIVTFVAVPVVTGTSAISLLLFGIVTMLYYSIGTTLEQRWGATRFTVYYGLGTLLSAVGGLLLGMFPNYAVAITAGMSYVNLSLFFAFATLYPELQFMVYFIIPVKAKWLGYLAAAQYIFGIGSAAITGNLPVAIVAVLALFNYFIFFWDEISYIWNKKSRQRNRRKDPQVVNFKKAQKDLQKNKEYLHKCTICGATDVSHPDMEFRYCSKCNGYHCYCSDHINHHIHIE